MYQLAWVVTYLALSYDNYSLRTYGSEALTEFKRNFKVEGRKYSTDLGPCLLGMVSRITLWDCNMEFVAKVVIILINLISMPSQPKSISFLHKINQIFRASYAVYGK